MRAWDDLPEELRCEEVRKYYEELKKHRKGLFLKRVIDVAVAIVLLILLSPVLLIISLVIVVSSPGGVLFRQRRVTTYGRVFTIYKFRTMVKNADRMGSQVTAKGDARITKTGHFLRKVRLDELPQLINILKGDMSLVGTRPEVEKYVASYDKEMRATLLMRAGVTSEASITYRDEAKLLALGGNIDEIYIKQVLPEKMKYNLDYVRHFSIGRDLKLIIKTVIAVLH